MIKMRKIKFNSEYDNPKIKGKKTYKAKDNIIL